MSLGIRELSAGRLERIFFLGGMKMEDGFLRGLEGSVGNFRTGEKSAML